MRIYFSGITNKNYCMINSITFRLPNGCSLTIDRDETEYTIEDDGEISMTWYGCYLWEIDGYNIVDHPAYLNDDGAGLLEGAELESVNLEDDADEDYYVIITSWEAC